MKEHLTKFISDGFKYVVGVGIAVLVARGLVSTEVGQDLTQQSADLITIGSGFGATMIVGIIQHFLAKRKSSGDSTGSGGSLVPLLCMMAVLSMALPSCNFLSEYPITGSIGYRDPETGAKGGLVFRPGEKPKASIKIPIYDGDGNLTGYADLEGPLSREVKVNPEK